MKLKVKFLKWSAGIPTAMLNKETADRIGIHTKDRISIRTFSKYPKEMSTPVETVEGLVGKKEIAVSTEIKKIMGLEKSQKVDVNLSEPPKSIYLIKKKLNGKVLSEKEIDLIIEDIVNNSLSQEAIALFVSAMYRQGMDSKETIYLIKAILRTANKIKLRKKFVVDKHSIGGVPGNRTTPIIVSICAAAGLTMPKTSSRAITSAAGTADVIEAIADVEFPMKTLRKIIKKTNACMVWGGALGMVPADSKIIRTEKILKLDPEAQLLASIMAKKLAAGSKYLVIDIPYGKGAKIVNRQKAVYLRERFEKIAKHFKIKISCVLTDGSQPIGNGIGPMLELQDVIKILNPREVGPKDLEEKSLFLASKLLEMTGKSTTGKGIDLARNILYSGKAFKKFNQIIKAQNGSINRIRESKFKKLVIANKSGKVHEINNKKITSLARLAGCPVDKASGIYLYVHKGDKVKKGDRLFEIHSESKTRLTSAIDFYHKNNFIKIRY